KKKGIDLKDIQVLAPMYRSQAGITMINKHLQQVVNPKTPGKREKKMNDVIFRVGDKVIQLVNQPEDGVFNGDIGEIVAILKKMKIQNMWSSWSFYLKIKKLFMNGKIT